MSAASLTAATASKFSGLALKHITREYPNHIQHILNGPLDLKEPRDLHPVFFGSFDWHSSVHGYWLLATILRLFPEIEQAGEIRRLFDTQLTPSKVEAEIDYLDQPLRRTFERTYGWAWLLVLAAELSRHQRNMASQWSTALAPLATAFSDRFLDFLPKATYPIRVGTHFNSAFAIALALEYAEVAGDDALRQLLMRKARDWYIADSDCQAWEPGGDDFLSPALMEAECMRRVLDGEEFSRWLDHFLPRLADRKPGTLFKPAIVSDRSDGKIAHLDGLNLSRAWCWRSIATTWSASDPRRTIALDAADAHLAASLPHVAGDYMGEHWLATFALLALI
ncbi:MAG: DUF2891 domain-containing protein [Gemmatimonadota bacterium]|nr:DUF2891 domain-containing protein [Gemmatimonadota bacterium]